MSSATLSASTLEKRLHRTFWLLLFVVFPLAYVPAAVLERLPQTWLSFPKGEQPDAFIPKIVVFVLVWLLGAGLALESVRRRQGKRLLAAPSRRTLLWCGAFITALVASSLFTFSYSNIALPFFERPCRGRAAHLVRGRLVQPHPDCGRARRAARVGAGHSTELHGDRLASGEHLDSGRSLRFRAAVARPAGRYSRWQPAGDPGPPGTRGGLPRGSLGVLGSVARVVETGSSCGCRHFERAERRTGGQAAAGPVCSLL